MKKERSVKEYLIWLKKGVPMCELDAFADWWKLQNLIAEENPKVSRIIFSGSNPMFEYIKSNSMYFKIIQYNCLAAIYEEDFIYQAIVLLHMEIVPTLIMCDAGFPSALVESDLTDIFLSCGLPPSVF